MKKTKNQVHQTEYFKLENCKNQVQINRRRLFQLRTVDQIQNPIYMSITDYRVIETFFLLYYLWIRIFRALLFSCFSVLVLNHLLENHVKGTVGFKSIEIGKKVLHSFDHVFHVYLMSGLQKYEKKKKITSPFWDNPHYRFWDAHGQAG